MDIGLLSTSMNVYSTGRIAEEAEKRGHYLELIDHTRCSVQMQGGKPRILFDSEDITESFDAVIPRIGAKVTRHGAAVIRQFELNGVFSTAKASALLKARNKVHTLQLMAKKSIPFPKTIFSIHPDMLESQLRTLGGPPVVIKLREGTQGLGVVLAESIASARSIADTFYKLDTEILLQEYIPEAGGQDLRLFVVGNKVVGSVMRSSPSGEFRSNVHRGGSAVPIDPTYQEINMALKAAKHIGLGVAGVDLIRSERGPLLLEVNASPGLQGIEEASDLNVAARIIKYVEMNAGTSS